MHFSTRPETAGFRLCLDLMNGCRKLNGAARPLTGRGPKGRFCRAFGPVIENCKHEPPGGEPMERNRARGRKTVTARAVTLLGAWMGVAAGGCGGVSGIPIDATATRIADTVCPKAYSCCTPDELGMNGEAGPDVASCESMTKSNYQGILSTLQSSVDQKRAVYVSSNLDTCLANVQSMDCAALNVANHLTGVAGCDSFTTPLVQIGGACSQDYECINGWCNVSSTSTNGDGTCAAFLGSGQDCTSSGGPSCGPSQVCDIYNELCEPVSDINGPCADDLQCKSLNCTSSGGTGMTCQASTAPPPTQCFYQSGCSEAGGKPGAGSLILFAAFAAVALARARRARRSR
jgi:hypothetical protein